MSYSDTTKAVFELALGTLGQEASPELMEILQKALAEENIHDVDVVTRKLLSAIRKADDNAD